MREKILASKIHLDHATGRNSILSKVWLTQEDVTEEGQTLWDVANVWLREKAWLVEMRLDEVDFMVLYEDGYTYHGIIELMHPTVQSVPRLEEHILCHCLFYTGQQCPMHMTMEEYTNFLKVYMDDTKKAYLLSYLKHYEIGETREERESDDTRC